MDENPYLSPEEAGDALLLKVPMCAIVGTSCGYLLGGAGAPLALLPVVAVVLVAVVEYVSNRVAAIWI